MVSQNLTTVMKTVYRKKCQKVYQEVVTLLSQIGSGNFLEWQHDLIKIHLFSIRSLIAFNNLIYSPNNICPSPVYHLSPLEINVFLNTRSGMTGVDRSVVRSNDTALQRLFEPVTGVMMECFFRSCPSVVFPQSLMCANLEKYHHVSAVLESRAATNDYFHYRLICRLFFRFIV